MTNTTYPADYYNATETDSGRLSHKACTHPSTARDRHNCRYETAKKNFAATAAHRKPADRGPIIIRNMNEA